MFAEKFAVQYPRITVEPDRIYVQDGRVYTSAGVTAGMDLALALVEEDFGSASALQVARALVLFLRRPGGQAQFSSLLSLQASEYRPLRELQVWIAENLKQDLSVENLAARAAMSPRNFARVFAREFGVTPAHFVENLRLEASRRELETTAKSSPKTHESLTGGGNLATVFHSVTPNRRVDRMFHFSGGFRGARAHRRRRLVF